MIAQRNNMIIILSFLFDLKAVDEIHQFLKSFLIDWSHIGISSYLNIKFNYII